jgi:hypothetical protein
LNNAQIQAIGSAVSSILSNPQASSSTTATFNMPPSGGGASQNDPLAGPTTITLPLIYQINIEIAEQGLEIDPNPIPVPQTVSGSKRTAQEVTLNTDNLSSASAPAVQIPNPAPGQAIVVNSTSRTETISNIIRHYWDSFLQLIRLRRRTQPQIADTSSKKGKGEDPGPGDDMVGGRRKSKRRLGSSNRRTKVRRGKKGGMKKRVTKKGIKHRYTKKVRKVSRPSTLARRSTQMQKQMQNQNYNQNQMQKQMQTQMQRQNQSQMKKMSKQQMQKLMMQRQMMQYSQQQQY